MLANRKTQLITLILSVTLTSGTTYSAVPGPVTQVNPLMGRPTFFLDGKPFTKPLFATYVPQKRYYAQMADVGCELFNFQTNNSACDFGFSRPTWSGPDQWDFSQIDERAHAILSAKPDGLIMPRIYIGTPQWWWEKYPEEMIVLDHGGNTYQGPHNQVFNMKRPYACIASPKWREDMAQGLRKTIEHIQQSDYAEHIFGYEIAALGSEEWYHMTVNQLQLGDYNPHMRTAFQQWLKEKYQTNPKLQASWRQAEITFAQVEIPGKAARLGNQNQTFRNPVAEMPVIDFYLFYNDIVADTIDYFAGVVKQVSNRNKVVGAFYDYMYEFRGGPEFGHNAGGRIMRSENIDFICAPPSYYERQLGSGAECYRRPFLPGSLHNKLWFHDNDLASFLFYDLWRKRNTPEETIAKYAAQIHPTATAQESVWLYQRAAGFVLCEGIYESYFDLHGGYFDHPQILHALRDVTRALDESKNRDRSSIAEILILADEESLSYAGFQSDWPDHSPAWRLNRMLMEHQIPFLKAGLPFDSGLLDDLDLIEFDRYKLVVFLNTWHVSVEDRQKIKEKIQCDNRVLLWCYAPGIFQENNVSADLISSLTGIEFNLMKDEERKRLIDAKQILTQAGQNWLQQNGENQLVESFGPSEKIGRVVAVADQNVDSLAVLEGSDVLTLVKKKMNDWTSMYSLTPVLTPGIVRVLARSAGVHIFSESNDTFYANKSYITLNAGDTGEKIIKLPFKANVYQAIDNQLYFQAVDSFTLSLMEDETIILRYQSN